MLLNPPTSWFWNIRVGDKIQINNAGPWYTVVGPMVVRPRSDVNGCSANTELFVNVGPPGTRRRIARSASRRRRQPRVPVPRERAGRQRQRLDRRGLRRRRQQPGVRTRQRLSAPLADDLLEWEPRRGWAQSHRQRCTNQRPTRSSAGPTPATNAREIALPTNVVIDLTTWGTTP